MPEHDRPPARRTRLRTAGGAALRVIAVWAVGTVTMLILAGILPDFRLQSEDGDSATTIAVTAAAGAGAFGVLGAVVWPVVVRALLLVPALVLGLLAFFINGSLLWIALSLIPAGRGEADPETAVVVAAVMSAASSAAGTALAVRDDGAYRRRLARLAYRRIDREELAKACDGPGTVILQLDGVGHDVLLNALQPRDCGVGHKKRTLPPLMETVAEWHGATHRLTEWRTDWSSQTGASQLGILHGSNTDVPAFRWYEKDTGQVMVCNRPSSAAELQARAARNTGHTGLLGRDGASRGNLFTGGAREVALVLSVAARRGRDNRSRAGYFAYFSDPANFSRTFASFVAEVFREVGQSLMTRLRREQPRVSRGGLYPFIRAFATVVQRDVVVSAVLGDMLAGRNAVYADLVAYDEVSHYAGPYHRNTHQVLHRLDRQIRMIAKVAEYAPRDYRIVLLSDHGQSEGPTFAARYGLTLQDLVRAGCGLPVSRRARKTPSGAEARAAARAALRRPEEAEEAEEPAAAERGKPAEPIVLGSGNLGLISFPDMPGRVSREELDRRHPALLRTLAEHPGVGFLLIRSEEFGPLVLGRNCSEHHLDTGKIVGEDPLAPFGPGAADAVRRTAEFPHAPDIMVNSAYDPDTGEVHAFEDQVGSHGGLGGDQSRPFLFWPEELTPPVTGGAEIVGAEQVHAILEGWLGNWPELERPGLAGEPAEAEV
ncbi:alkaline phosphatase family protein [Streptomyces sp. A7024]|uniref:Alkaline phosphatase family protein n=1 Tax=Streptomyces coryli TaxID=1128680 RepID=A0A6G4UE16_9ACTN|nr:phage holin family protein [Streptomyces coryli]NGN70272.1 alkaline phosphatase family protein [Streptomyces coryli]